MWCLNDNVTTVVLNNAVANEIVYMKCSNPDFAAPTTQAMLYWFRIRVWRVVHGFQCSMLSKCMYPSYEIIKLCFIFIKLSLLFSIVCNGFKTMLLINYLQASILYCHHMLAILYAVVSFIIIIYVFYSVVFHFYYYVIIIRNRL